MALNVADSLRHHGDSLILRCATCGAVDALRMPVPVGVMVKRTNRFTRYHDRCEKLAAEPVSVPVTPTTWDHDLKRVVAEEGNKQ